MVLSDQIKESGKSKSWDGSSRNDILMLYAQLWVEKLILNIWSWNKLDIHTWLEEIR